MSTPTDTRVTSLDATESARVINQHPELVAPNLPDPAIIAVSVSADQADRLRDMLSAVLESLDVREGAAGNMLRTLLPPGALTVSRAAGEQIRRNAEAQLALAEEFGLLSSADVAAQARSKAGNPAALASRWRKEGRVFTVDVDGASRYPAYQFGPGGRPLPVIATILATLAGRLSGWELALWFTGDTDWLGGTRPVDHLHDAPEQVVSAVRRLVDELAA